MLVKGTMNVTPSVASRAHHHGRNDKHGADRQVDAGCKDDDRLRDGDNAGHRHLLQDQRQRACGHEIVRQRAKSQNADNQNDRRNGRRVGSQETAGA